ncbi:UDP-glucose 4-epimerase family protein [Pseudomonas protegens]|uniref:UDP-glucose 4-epimerase family protein n=1 Tax=Pseudomonas protegens TaxID=380021 RepID=UPI00200E0BC4|nr:SDR family oxidoreductase [Pseudomonas protegens]
MARILLTGASGFVGGAVHECLSKNSPHKLTVVVRKPIPALAATTSVTQVEQIDGLTDWSSILLDCNVVVHAADCVHVMHESSLDPFEAFRKVNVEGTLNLARQAAQRGVGRFVFISSIKVNGEGTSLNVPYTADDEPVPTDPYSISKMEAEKGLTLIASQTGMEVVIIRPVLVYGPSIKANFLNMMRGLCRGGALPFGVIDSRRSLGALDNLVDLIVTCVEHPLAANQVFSVSDGEDLSTTEMLKGMGGALGKPARLLAMPSGILSFSATLLGKKSISQRLCGSLQVDISKNRELLRWSPPLGVDKTLDATAKYFIDSCA